MVSRWKAIVAVLSVLTVLAFANLAGAHAQRLSATPAPDAVILSAPDEVSITFTEELASIMIEVFNANGHAVTVGAAVVDANDAATVKVPLKAALPIGSYTVKWKADSVDGHSSQGRYKFHITNPSESSGPRIFLDGKEVTSDVPAQIVNGRTMLPLRAVAEALGKTVEWDEQSQFVRIFDAPSAHHAHNLYQHPTGTEAPTVKLHVTADAKSGFNLMIQTTNWTWAPEKVNTDPVPNEGHAHLYVDGVKLGRLYGPHYHLTGLKPGQHDIRVTLNANDHSDYAVGDHSKLESTVSVIQSISGPAMVQEGHGDAGHDAGHDH